jgi:L-lactate dehydrogenase complex protein LldG
MISSSESEKILGRVREALKVPAPRPDGPHSGPSQILSGPQPATEFRQWLPSVGDSFAECLQAFQTHAASLKADFHLLDSREELVQQLLALRDAEGWTRIGTHSGGLNDVICPELNLPICRTDRPYETKELERCSVGITQCDGLVAQTGSVLVTSRSCGGRALSVLPPHHVVLAHRQQLVRDLVEAFALLKTRYAPDYPSFISFISGPSRTGDIERILVLGAHGPKKLSIFCL